MSATKSVCATLFGHIERSCFHSHKLFSARKLATIPTHKHVLQPRVCWYDLYFKRCASKIYTKTGDHGESSLFTGERRPKSNNVFEALGDIDELNSNIGLCREVLSESWQHDNFEELSSMLGKVQCCLQDVASCVATPKSTASDKHIQRVKFEEDLVSELEDWIDQFTKDLPELKSFILPSGGKSSCTLHICRSVCRRAERKVANLLLQKEVDEIAAKYINRLSDFLFTLARYVASMEGQPEVIYKKPKQKSKLHENASTNDTNKLNE